MSKQGEPCMCRYDGDGNLIGAACLYHERLPSDGEWKAHQAFYKLTVAQRDGAWRESEVLRGAIKGFLATWDMGERDGPLREAIDNMRTVLARVEEFVP